MRQKIIAGNWKMHGNTSSITQLVEDIEAKLPSTLSCQVLLCPPSIYITKVRGLIRHPKMSVGAQNVYYRDSGAFTGEISAPMLKDVGCGYSLVGHSERRTLFAENEKMIAEKFHHVKDHDIIPVLCIGETLEQRESKQTEQVLHRQLMSLVKEDTRCFQDVVIAYEPVWAIGSGKSATPEQVQEAHQLIRQIISTVNKEDALRVPLLYGGSVNEKNAASLFAMPDVDGGLIGGASLNAQQFVDIVQCINSF